MPGLSQIFGDRRGKTWAITAIVNGALSGRIVLLPLSAAIGTPHFLEISIENSQMDG
jgi:hypothetical protein